MKELIISSSVIIIVITAMRFALHGKISPRLQYALWGLVLIRLLLPVNLFSSSFSVMNILDSVLDQRETQPVASENDIPVKEVHPTGYSDYSTQVQSNNSSTINIETTAKIVWYFGIVLMGLFLIWANISFYLRLRRTRKRIEGGSTKVKVYVAEHLSTPCLFGFLRPAVYITPEVAADDEKLGYVLTHELTHLRQHDNFWSIMRCLCLAIHWYNPLVWLAAILSKRDAELACDEATIKMIGEKNRLNYGRTLIGLTIEKHSPSDILCCATTMALGKKGIKERILFIARKPRMLVTTVIVVIFIIAITVGCTFTGSIDKNEKNNEAATKPTDFTLSSTAYARMMDGGIINGNNSCCGCYTYGNGEIYIYYDNPKTTVTVPTKLFKSTYNNYKVQFSNLGVFVLPEKTVIAYGTERGDDPVTVLISDDKGKNWSVSTIDDKLKVNWICTGFSSADDGWLIVCGDVATGNEEHSIYMTSDGGKTWDDVKSDIDSVYGGILSGAGFMDNRNGFMCFRDDTPAVCVTRDGGQTWKQLDLEMPEEYAEYSKTPMSPIFNETVTILPVILGKVNGEGTQIIYLESKDYGENWSVCDYKVRISDSETDSETDNLFAQSTGNIDDYMPDLILYNDVSDYDLLPCLENFNPRTCLELDKKYGRNRWFPPLFEVLKKAAIGRGQYMRDYYMGCAILVMDEGCLNDLINITVAQWEENCAVYARCLHEKFSDEDKDELGMMLCRSIYLLHPLEDAMIFNDQDSVSSVVLTTYPEYFPFSRYGENTKVTREETEIEGYGKSVTLEGGGQSGTRRLRFLNAEEGIYYLYDILTVNTGDMAYGITVGDKVEEVENVFGADNILKTDKFAGDDYYGMFDEVWVYKPDDDNHKYIAYVIDSGYVRGIQLIDGLDTDVY